MWFVKYTFLIDGDNSINHFRVLNNLLCCVYCLNFECFTIDKSNAVKLSREIIWFRDIFQKIRQGWDRLFKASVRYFSVFLKDKCISSLSRTKYIEKKFNLQLFFLPTVSQTFILSRATTRYPPPWNFLCKKINCICNRDNARDVNACPDK